MTLQDVDTDGVVTDEVALNGEVEAATLLGDEESEADTDSDPEPGSEPESEPETDPEADPEKDSESGFVSHFHQYIL